jgi:D-alanine transaminase
MLPYPEKVYLNGKIIPAEDAAISVFDRGFLFGDGIYEVMAHIGGRFFYEEDHIHRLKECLQKIQIEFDVAELLPHIPLLLQSVALSDKDCLLYIQVTRGVAPRQHAYPKHTTPTVMMYAVPKVLPDINTVHASVVTAEDVRWLRCDIKMTSLLGNVMANEYAMQNGCYETLLVRNGVVTEASHCNVFFVKDRVVYTHPANTFILDGITRKIVLQLCKKLHIEVRETGVLKADIKHMDEAFLTGTSTQIAAIKQCDEHEFYTKEEVGTITKTLQTAFLELKKEGKLP